MRPTPRQIRLWYAQARATGHTPNMEYLQARERFGRSYTLFELLLMGESPNTRLRHRTRKKLRRRVRRLAAALRAATAMIVSAYTSNE
jgi:hypothetical protein